MTVSLKPIPSHNLIQAYLDQLAEAGAPQALDTPESDQVKQFQIFLRALCRGYTTELSPQDWRDVAAASHDLLTGLLDAQQERYEDATRATAAGVTSPPV